MPFVHEGIGDHSFEVQDSRSSLGSGQEAFNTICGNRESVLA